MLFDSNFNIINTNYTKNLFKPLNYCLNDNDNSFTNFDDTFSKSLGFDTTSGIVLNDFNLISFAIANMDKLEGKSIWLNDPFAYASIEEATVDYEDKKLKLTRFNLNNFIECRSFFTGNDSSNFKSALERAKIEERIIKEKSNLDYDVSYDFGIDAEWDIRNPNHIGYISVYFKGVNGSKRNIPALFVASGTILFGFTTYALYSMMPDPYFKEILYGAGVQTALGTLGLTPKAASNLKIDKAYTKSIIKVACDWLSAHNDTYNYYADLTFVNNMFYFVNGFHFDIYGDLKHKQANKI